MLHFAQVQLFRRGSGDLFLDVEPISLEPTEAAAGAKLDLPPAERVWMINTDETHSQGAFRRFIEGGVAAIWGYPEQGAPLQLGAQVATRSTPSGHALRLQWAPITRHGDHVRVE
jgi:hypothetical protein